MYTDLLSSESGNWSLSEVNNADYNLLMELFTTDSKPKKEKLQDPIDFFGTFMSPQDMAKVRGETS
ncbi:tail tape measure chaperone protein [Enterococcus phage 9184]|uniref:Tail tape measure chaperone protein n=1 Tax=Enterococcus phage 9184 TaxID=2763103 RepID=A0A7L8ZJU7_9CAUD|nr:tail tape measure chaperone protein [Enterococcus phage 9184]